MKCERDHITYYITEGEMVIKVKVNCKTGRLAIWPFNKPNIKQHGFTFEGSDPHKIDTLAEMFKRASKLGMKIFDSRKARENEMA